MYDGRAHRSLVGEPFGATLNCTLSIATSMSNVTNMGTRTLWLCLSLGLACSPKPTLLSTQHSNSTNEAASRRDAGATGNTGEPLADAGRRARDGGTDNSWLALSDAASVDDILDAAPSVADAGESSTGRNIVPDASHHPNETSVLTDAMRPLDAALDSPGDAGTDAWTCDIPAITGSECNMATNCGCDATTVCRVANQHTGQTLCFAPGETPIYSPCDLDQDCGAEHVCEAGLCRPQCDNPGHFCEDGSSCASFSEDGRYVCVGHCNVLARSPDTWSKAATWIEVMAKQLEREMRDDYWTAEYSDCGEGAYCHPGVGPDEAASPRPLFPHCVPAKGYALDNGYCSSHADCVSGLACGLYPGETEGRCVRTGFVEGDCQNTGHRVQRETSIDGETLVSPDGLNTLGLCTKNL